MLFIKLDHRAFTLLELLVAMTMMSIIAASLYSSMSIGFKAKESAERVVEKGRAAEIAVELIKNMLTSSLIPDGILAGEFKGQDEQNEKGYDADNLVFHASDYAPEEGELASDIEKVEIGMDVRKDTGEHVIYRKTTINLLSPATLDPDEEILCGGVRSLNLRYYNGSDWVDEWASADNDNSLPSAVEVTIVMENTDKNGDIMINDKQDLYTFTETIILPCSTM
jgi:type II secretion system protein J